MSQQQTLCLFLPGSVGSSPATQDGLTADPQPRSAGPSATSVDPSSHQGPTRVITAGTARGLLQFPSATLKPVNPTQNLFLPTFPFLANSSEPDKQETGVSFHSHPSSLLHHSIVKSCWSYLWTIPNPGTAHLTAAVYLACTEASLTVPSAFAHSPSPINQHRLHTVAREKS